MNITTTGNHEFAIHGDIKTIGDYQEIKSVIQAKVDQGTNNLVVCIHDSQTITSSIVGYFMKLVNLNNVTINLQVKNEKLYSMLEDLVLVDVFNAKKV
jgi:hypothetical protein